MIEKEKYLKKMGLDELFESLMANEITMKSNDEGDENKKNMGTAFKASSSKIEEEINDDDDSDKNMDLFT